MQTREIIMKKLLVLFMLITSPAYADVWIQYDLTTGAERATNSQKVSDAALAANDAAQILYTGNGDASGLMVDVTKSPPVLIAAPSPPAPPASEIDLIFNAMVQSGQIDPATVDPDTLARVNASLAVSGAATIAIPVNSKVNVVGR